MKAIERKVEREGFSIAYFFYCTFSIVTDESLLFFPVAQRQTSLETHKIRIKKHVN